MVGSDQLLQQRTVGTAFQKLCDYRVIYRSLRYKVSFLIRLDKAFYRLELSPRYENIVYISHRISMLLILSTIVRIKRFILLPVMYNRNFLWYAVRFFERLFFELLSLTTTNFPTRETKVKRLSGIGL